MKEYKIGFSLKGLIAFLIIMLPNFFWMIIPPTNSFLSTNSSSVDVLNIIMAISQWIMIALLMLLIRKTGGKEKGIYKLICGLCVGIYYISWVLFYLNIVSSILFIGMAVFPCCFFISFILWQKTYPILIPAAIFAFIHIGVTVFNVS